MKFYKVHNKIITENGNVHGLPDSTLGKVGFLFKMNISDIDEELIEVSEEEAIEFLKKQQAEWADELSKRLKKRNVYFYLD